LGRCKYTEIGGDKQGGNWQINFVNRLNLAKALSSLFTLPSLKRDGNELHAILHSLPLVLTDGIKEMSIEALAKFRRLHKLNKPSVQVSTLERVPFWASTHDFSTVITRRL